MPALVQAAPVSQQPVADLKKSKQQAINSVDLLDRLNSKDAAVREEVLKELAAAAKSENAAAVAPYLLDVLDVVLDRVSDKVRPVQVAADVTAKAITKSINEYTVKTSVDVILKHIANGNKWQEKYTAITLLDILVQNVPEKLERQVPKILPVVSEAMWDSKAETKKAAKSTMLNVCRLVKNPDIENFVPQLVESIADPTKVPETIANLAGTVFVNDIRAPTLALLVPLLERGLTGRNAQETTRDSVLIARNMANVVEDEEEIEEFLPKMIPALKIAEPFLKAPPSRKLAVIAAEQLEQIGGVVDGKYPEISHAADLDVVYATLQESLVTFSIDPFYTPVLKYIASIAAQFVDERNHELSDWKRILLSYFTIILPESEASDALETFRKRVKPRKVVVEEEEEDDEEEGEDLCRCRFKLTLAKKLLLKESYFHLKRGRRYAVCGPNGAGKSTLLRKLHEDTVPGFPSKQELGRVLVEVETIDASDPEILVVDFVQKDNLSVSREKIIEELKKVAFTNEMVVGRIGHLSGGWKMKLALTSAMLQGPDLLLLDEPTNHLDVFHIKWLTDYLLNLKTVSSMIVSHDKNFLQVVSQGVLHYEKTMRLKLYKCGLDEFIDQCPSAKAYRELKDTEEVWHFPEPGPLENVTSEGQFLVRIDRMNFKYPTAADYQLKDISLKASRKSRVSITGPNGAGKSTLIKTIIGDLIPEDPKTIKVHENCRIAYMSQSAFEMLTPHGEKTPFQYLQWRFSSGEDIEADERANRKLEIGDVENLNKVFKCKDGPRKVVQVLRRRKGQGSKNYDYECEVLQGNNIGQKNETWTPMTSAFNEWIPREDLLASHSKQVADVDREAVRFNNPLTEANVHNHCAGFALGPELVEHTRIRGLSGGQKVRLVLAAAFWLHPHILMLDEPSNFLDRDSIGAMAKALNEFKGGVICISHSREFLDSVAKESEEWRVDNGYLTPLNNDWKDQGKKILQHTVQQIEVVDAQGNKTIKEALPKADGKVSGKEKRAARKAKKGKKGDDDDDDY